MSDGEQDLDFVNIVMTRNIVGRCEETTKVVQMWIHTMTRDGHESYVWV